MAKIHFFDTLSLTPYLDHLLKSDLHQNWQKVSQDTPLHWVVRILCYCTTCGLYKAKNWPKWVKIQVFGDLAIGFGVKVISYNWYIVQSCPSFWGRVVVGSEQNLILAGGGGGQRLNLILGGGWCQWVKPHFGRGVVVVVVVIEQNLISAE